MSTNGTRRVRRGVKLASQDNMPRADLAIAIIAKNAAKTIGGCLDSIVPYVKQVVVCVDELSTDSTAHIAAQHGATVIKRHPVSIVHKCPEHGEVAAQHFGRSRDLSFSYLDPTAEFLGWIDADDIVRGGENLVDVLGKLPPHIAGIWLAYHYSQTPNGATATLFHRERFLRRSIGWHWQHRVHEIAVPNHGHSEQLQWATTDRIGIWHQSEGHNTESSARRNILLLEIELEESPDQEMRCLFYLGNQYFALSDWPTAIAYYERSLSTDNTYQRWQSQLYLSMAYERLGNLDAAKHYAYSALDTIPYHPEPYYRLATVAMYEKDAKRCEFWTSAVGDHLPDAPFFAFKNPLDRTYNARLCLAQAYMNDGQTSRARAEMERAAAVVPEPTVMDSISTLRKLEDEAQEADAYVRVLTGLDGAVSDLPIPAHAWKFGRVRDIVVPKMIRHRANTQPRIIFWCGQSIEPWAPTSLNTTGIGGSETAVIEIARRFAKDGWLVDVYNNPDKYEGVYDSVGYWGLARLSTNEQAEILVSWRNPEVYSLPVKRQASLLWCHDLNRGPDTGVNLEKWDKVLGVSHWHSNYLSQLYDIKNTSFVPNGIDLTRFINDTAKVPFRCVYASSPDRGLLTLLNLWTAILQREPQAELHIAYGWDTIDRSIALGLDRSGYLQTLKQQVMSILERTPRVVWRGRLPQDELAKLYQESYCWLYPTTFLEVSCISAMESMASGCVPVTSAAGALPETIGNAGVVVTGNPYSQAWKDYWLSCAIAALISPPVRLPLVPKGVQRSHDLTWDCAYEERWKPIILGLLESREDMDETKVLEEAYTKGSS